MYRILFAKFDSYQIQNADSETTESETVSVLCGDVNEDGKIDILDVITFAAALHSILETVPVLGWIPVKPSSAETGDCHKCNSERRCDI